MAHLRQDERLLTNGRITTMEFVDRNSHSADGLIERTVGGNETSEDDSEDDEIIEDDDIVPPPNANMGAPESMCLSCGHACGPEKYLLVPCGHQPFCNICQDNPTCSVCNLDVNMGVRMVSAVVEPLNM